MVTSDDRDRILNSYFTFKMARLMNKMTVREASSKLDVSPATLSNYETGKTEPPIFVCKKMSEIYGIPQEKILFCTDEECAKVLREGA